MTAAKDNRINKSTIDEKGKALKVAVRLEVLNVRECMVAIVVS